MKIDRSIKETLKVDAKGNCERAKIIYVISEASNSGDAVELARLSAPEKLGSARKNSVTVTDSPGGGIFEVAVDYLISRTSAVSSPDKKSGDRFWSCSIQDKKNRKFEAYSTKKYKISADRDLDPGNMLNWNGHSGAFSKSGSVDVISPEFTETCIAVFKKSAITASFLKKIANIVGKVNNSTFHHWAAGEVLFTGMSQGEVYENSAGQSLCDITFNFSIRPNETRTVGDKKIDLPGWDYIWFLPTPDNTGIQMAYVSQVYQRTDYSKLGL